MAESEFSKVIEKLVNLVVNESIEYLRKNVEVSKSKVGSETTYTIELRGRGIREVKYDDREVAMIKNFSDEKELQGRFVNALDTVVSELLDEISEQAVTFFIEEINRTSK